MKKNILIIITFLFFRTFVSAQNVGIGGSSFTPLNMLDVKGKMVIGTGYAGISTAPADGLLIQGNTGIGTASPRGVFDVFTDGNIYLSNSTTTGTAQSLFLPGHIFIAPYSGTNISYVQARRSDNSGTTELQFRTYNAGSLNDALRINGLGNVGIGTTSPGFKLDVNGIVRVPSGNYFSFENWQWAIGKDMSTQFSSNEELQLMGYGSSGNSFQIIGVSGVSPTFTYSRILQANFDNGRVGIGTNPTNSLLEVNGGIRILTSPSGDLYGSGLILNDESNASLWHQIHIHGNRIRAYDGSTEDIYVTTTDINSSINGTTNYVAKFTNANSIGNSQIYDNGTAVGINTTNPAQGKLWVQGGDIWVTGDNMKLAFTTDGSTDAIPNASIIASQNGISGASADLVFNTWNGSSNAEIMRIRSNGNVGIGTTSPAIKLEVRSDGTGTWQGRMGLSNATSDKQVFFGNYGTIAGVFAHNFALNAWADLYLNTVSGTTGMVVKGDGNVGIGTTNPGAKIEVNGQVKITGGSPGSGKVLTSDATGLGTWSYNNPTAVVSSSLHPSMDDITWGTTLISSCVDDGVYTINWGFNFNIDGTNYTQGWISTNGILGFGTSTSTAFTNTALPTSISTDPMLFFHWDDDGADIIRYVVQGTSPNRNCFIQWQGSDALSCTGGADRVMVYITLTEGSNVVSVRYLNQGSAADAQGAGATFGFQYAGGSSARTIPLGYNTKLLDDNASNQHFSIDF